MKFYTQVVTYSNVLNREVSSFQVVGIEGFHCIQRCPHFRGLGSALYRGVLISEIGMDSPLLLRVLARGKDDMSIILQSVVRWNFRPHQSI